MIPVFQHCITCGEYAPCYDQLCAHCSGGALAIAKDSLSAKTEIINNLQTELDRKEELLTLADIIIDDIRREKGSRILIQKLKTFPAPCAPPCPQPPV
jgi:hypothetical protein